MHTCLYRLRIWPLSIKNEGGPWTEKWPVSHTEEITCFVITYDSLQIITGSKDMSLKVWQINGGKLSQVCVTDSLSLTPEIVYAYRTLFQKKKNRLSISRNQKTISTRLYVHYTYFRVFKIR